MKRIETINKKTIEEIIVTYEAIDGTLFSDESECNRYDETVEALLLHRLNDFQINTISCDDLFESGGEGDYRIVVPTNMCHIDTLNQLWKLNGGAANNDLLFTEDNINNIILVGVRFYCDKLDWVWFYKFNNVVKNITLGKYKIESND